MKATATLPPRGRRKLTAPDVKLRVERGGEYRPLPPDPDDSNYDRACWAGQALEKFIQTTKTDLEDALSDLLCDLMHWSDRQPIELQAFETALERARDAYRDETRAEG